MNIIKLNHTDKCRTETVKSEMKKLGPPTVKAVCIEGDLWVALEGSHRIQAAVELGGTILIDEVEYDEDVTLSDLGIKNEYGDNYTVAEIVDGAFQLANEGQLVEVEAEEI
jgi:hypothetical protein